MALNVWRQSEFFRLRPEARQAAWLSLGMAFFVVLDQLHYWRTREDFSFGYLVPVFVGYVLYERWPMLKSILVGPKGEASDVSAKLPSGGVLNFLAGTMVFFSLLVFFYGGFLRAVTGPDTDSAAALSLGLGCFVLAMGFLVSRMDAQGRVVALSKRGRVVALLVFPAFAWIISAPMLLVFENHVKPVLLEYVVGIVSGLFNVLGFAIIRDGSTLVLPHGAVGVADACSGIRSLTACLFAGSFLSAIFMDRFWKKIMLLSLSAVLAFVMNIARSLFLTGWAYAYNVDKFDAIDADFWGHPEFLKDKVGNFVKDAAGAYLPNPEFHLFTVHDFAGYSVLGLTLAGLLLLLPILNYKFELDDEPQSEPPAAQTPTPDQPMGT